MPNELNIALATTGLTVTCQPYQAGAAVGSAISCPETGSTGFYSGNMAGSAGTYQLAFRASSANVGSGSIVWDGTAEATSSAPSVVQIRAEMDSNSTKLANLDTTVSSRLAPSGTLAVVTTLTNAPASVTPAQIRAEMDANSTKLANLDAPISSRLATSGYTAPSAAPTAAAIRAEIDSNSTQLAAVKAKTDNLPASPAASGDIPSANITAIKAKTDALVTDRLAQCSTVATTGAQLAAALS